MSPKTRALLAILLFTLAGVVSVSLREPSEFLVPHALFYGVLLINTFFSIRFFSPLQPKTFLQFFADVVLALIYVALAFSIGNPVTYALFAMLLFVIGTQKYVLMRGEVPHKILLKRKIKANLAGAALCAVIVGGTIAGPALESAWILAIVFTIANVYLLLIKPMYQLPDAK